MDTEEMIHFLEHMEQCDFASTSCFRKEEAASAPAPSYLQEEIMKKELLHRKFRLPEKYMKPLTGSEASLCRFTDRCWNGCGTDHAFFCISE